MNRTKAGFAIGAMIAAQWVSPVAARDEAASVGLIEAAFERARTVSPDMEAASLACSANQRQMEVMDGSQLRYPCMLHDLIEDADDATMVVTLLLSAPAATDGDSSHPADQQAGRFVGEHDPALKEAQAGYVARGSELFRAEVTRADPVEDLARRRAEMRKLEAEERATEYRAVTRFLELAEAQVFCPADGRAFLARAIQYSTSPLEQDRMVGLWADAHRHALEPYLNDLSRCR